MCIAVIPARGGSKRIKNKNIKDFASKPILYYSITAAIESGLFSHVIVSTDSDDIAEVAEKYGAIAPFRRPAELSDDYTPTAPVLMHAIDWAMENGINAKHACCIYPTAPFVRPADLKEGFELLTSKDAHSVLAVTTFPFPIQRALRINSKGFMEMFWPEHEMTRSQDLPEAYHDAGQFCWVNCKKFRKNNRMYSEETIPVTLPRNLVQDIDTLEDWEAAEVKFEILKKQSLI
ncbi:pseudaminic acid cytidylyltransferase [Maridesulfovibrio salexigens]|uniref:N-acylneuraminate cytidylyltransferase n=1 Tax=Maridesulfovibrio salexigens (strain ATCC 14822 / DSM 2638 / NCIMB 8403 / VKM B-1763) TaxID=526222 RepID=C6BTJ7_MARSD|nr:pseudaminic acid cytidylyltransferase [Maridesulfovibrio salexigens]ACS81678.1 N-acylneuraminate cytidylyltransferase [Maridesulfovibrio salexigens DSM 2638]